MSRYGAAQRIGHFIKGAIRLRDPILEVATEGLMGYDLSEQRGERYMAKVELAGPQHIYNMLMGGVKSESTQHELVSAMLSRYFIEYSPEFLPIAKQDIDAFYSGYSRILIKNGLTDIQAQRRVRMLRHGVKESLIGLMLPNRNLSSAEDRENLLGTISNLYFSGKIGSWAAIMLLEIAEISTQILGDAAAVHWTRMDQLARQRDR